MFVIRSVFAAGAVGVVLAIGGFTGAHQLVKNYLDDGKIRVKCETGSVAIAYAGWSDRCVWVATYGTQAARSADVAREARLYAHKDGTAHLSISEAFPNGSSFGHYGRTYREANAGQFASPPDVKDVRFVRFVNAEGVQVSQLVRVEVRRDN